MQYHIMCARPGMHRGGRPNPEHAEYSQGDHTPAQFRDLLADPHIRVVIGKAMTEQDIVAMEMAAAVQTEAAAQEAKRKTAGK